MSKPILLFCIMKRFEIKKMPFQKGKAFKDFINSTYYLVNNNSLYLVKVQISLSTNNSNLSQ
jgi:hypothetical protein